MWEKGDVAAHKGFQGTILKLLDRKAGKGVKGNPEFFVWDCVVIERGEIGDFEGLATVSEKLLKPVPAWLKS